MASKLQPHFFLLLLSVLLSAAAAHNITRILSDFKNLNTFNSLLSRTSVAADVNRLQTITVLAVNDAASAPIAGLPKKTLAEVLSIHVILDYYDTDKLFGLKNRSILLTTLFQTTGVAEAGTGFLNCTRLADGRVAFGSGVPGAPLVSTFVRQVAAMPYNISVLQITRAVVPPGIKVAPVVRKPKALAPAPTPADDGAEETPAPAGEAPASAPAPEEDAAAPAPEADAVAPGADAPAAEGPAGEEGKSSSGTRMVAGVGLLAAAGVAAVLAL